MPMNAQKMRSMSDSQRQKLEESGAIGNLIDSVKIYGKNPQEGHWDFDPKIKAQKKVLRRGLSSSKEFILL